MADLDASIIASSSKKHKRGLKTMKKKTPLIDMNTSVRRKRLNSSLTKKLNLSSKYTGWWWLLNLSSKYTVKCCTSVSLNILIFEHYGGLFLLLKMQSMFDPL